MTHRALPVRNAVIAVLKEHGPMTIPEIADHLAWDLPRTRSVIANGRRLHPGKLFRIIAYRRATESKGKDTGVFAAQAGPDKPRNPDKIARRKKTQASYRRRHQALINARHRKWRAEKQGRELVPNIWAPLLPSSANSVRAYMSAMVQA